MMKFIMVDEHGKIMQECVFPYKSDAMAHAENFPNLRLIECDAKYGINYIKNGKIKEYPDKPDEHHCFDYTIEQWIDCRTSEEITESVRKERNFLLAQCDWTQAADAPVDQAAWAVYRQALRDVPAQAGFPTDTIWPEKPL